MNNDVDPMIETPDYVGIKDAFAEELRFASEGETSSLSFIKHYLPEKPLLTEGTVQGIVIGGTNYILSTERLESGGKRTIIQRKTGILPTFSTKQILLDFFSQHMDQQADAIGINFGFPLNPTIGPMGEIDAMLIQGTKEHAFLGLTEPLGQLVASLFEQTYQKRIPVSIANDTICLMLSANEKIDSGLIVGTGMNMAIRQRLHDKDVLINLEAGNFNKFRRFNTLEKLDAQSEKPTTMLFEKCVSGKYLTEHFNILIDEFGLTTPPVQTGLELSALADGHTGKAEMDISRQIITRSARLVTSAIAGVYDFLGKPNSLAIIGEGSLLWNGWHYQETLKNQLQAFGIPENAINMQHNTDSSINGAIGLVTHS